MAEEDHRIIPAERGSANAAACSEKHTDEPTDCECGCDVSEHLPAMRASGLVEVSDGAVRLTELGVTRAEQLIRRHRLAEVLLTELLDLDTADSQTTSAVWSMPYLRMSRTASARSWAPPVCPHGRPIPRGNGCATITREVPPLVAPLSDAAIGHTYRIVFIAPKHHARLDRLAVLGITPGAEIRLHQKMPSYVVRIGETDVALDRDIAREIYVRPA